jgi:hypothetical protein
VIGRSGNRKTKIEGSKLAGSGIALSYSAPSERPLTVNPSLATMAGRTWPP